MVVAIAVVLFVAFTSGSRFATIDLDDASKNLQTGNLKDPDDVSKTPQFENTLDINKLQAELAETKMEIAKLKRQLSLHQNCNQDIPSSVGENKIDEQRVVETRTQTESTGGGIDIPSFVGENKIDEKRVKETGTQTEPAGVGMGNQPDSINTSAYLEDKVCDETSVSRRRRHGFMCQCRRRLSGLSEGLQPGWKCASDKIIFEKTGHEDVNCCCKAGKCTKEAARRGDAREVKKDGAYKCCKFLTKGLFGFCAPFRGYNELESNELCEEPKLSPSNKSCATVLVDWLSQHDWYEVLSDWEDHKDVYANYIPCMQTRDHVVKALINNENILKRIVHGSNENSMLKFIRNRPGCAGLSTDELSEAVKEFYDEVCIFGMPGKSSMPYSFVGRPKNTCAFNASSRSIILRPDTFCPEGHRCACPVYDEGVVLKNAAEFSTGSASKGYYAVSALSTAATYGAAYGFGAVGAFPSFVAAGVGAGAFVVAFGARYVWDTLRHSCESSIGCFPMDCVPVPQIGCRIRPAETLDDTRNPFWFMPPPKFKCHWKGIRCQISPCSKLNLFDQRIGLYNSKAKLGGGFSGVYNCQPILSQHMSAMQRKRFESIVKPLQRETQAHLVRLRELERRLGLVCPWKWPTSRNYYVQCNDGTKCSDRLFSGCCNDHKGIQRCSRESPVMCNNGQCDSMENLCRDHNGSKPCDAAIKCPWLEPTNAPLLAECNNDEVCGESWRNLRNGESCCADRGGLRRCPPEYPIMCDTGVCERTAKKCVDKGGPRTCDMRSRQPDIALEETE